MRMKLSGALTALLLACALTCAASGSDVTTELDLTTNELCVEGTALPGQRVSLTILNPKEDSEDSPYANTDLTDENAAQIIYTVLQCTADDKGEYSFAIAMSPDNQGGYYQLYVTAGDEPKAVKPVFYPSAQQLSDSLEDVNSSSSSNIKAALDHFLLVTGTEDENYPSVKSETSTKLLQFKNNSSSKEFANVAEVKQAFSAAVMLSVMDKGKLTKPQLTAYAAKLGIPLLPEYEDAAKEVVDALNQLGGAHISKISEIPPLLRSTTVLCLVNSATREQMLSLITEYSTDLLLDGMAQYDKFKSFDNETKYYVISFLTDGGFAKPDDFASAFEKAVNSYKPITGGGGGSGGGGGGGWSGGGGGGSKVVSSVISTPPDQEVLAPEQAKKKEISFGDLQGVEWAEEGIIVFAEKGIITGTAEGEFSPNQPITREQFVKILVAAFDLHDQQAKTSFSDCKEDDWFYSYVASAEKTGISTGREDGSFGVGNEITRQEIAVMLCRAVDYMGKELKEVSIGEEFADGSQIEQYAKKSVSRLRSAGIITGTPENTFMATAVSTRAQTVTMIYRLWKQL